MSRSLHIFSTEEEYQTFYNNIPYSTPFVSLIKSNGETHIDYKIPPPPFNLTALESGTITINIPAFVNSTYATSLSYSKDKSNWTETLVDSTNQTITIPVEIGDNVYLKGTARQWGSNTSNYMKINSTNNIKASGNIMSLLYGDDFADKTSFPSNSQYCLIGLFRDNSHLVNVGNLILPSTTLVEGCYHGMFWGCTSLTSAPELPAITLAGTCYNYMFRDCTSLTSAPELSATTLANGCYSSMFYGCTSLTSAPELHATTLANGCYSSMFRDCTSLTSAPELPATTLATGCYNSMFYGCTSLTSAPELPATTLVGNCYNSMFRDCTSLTSAPELSATTLTNGCYDSMFRGCTSLTSAPELHATILASICYSSMFESCTSLNSITMLATNISAYNCLSYWVSGVASTGTFTKAAAMTTLPSGASGIPYGWTVVDYQAAS